MNEDQTRDRLPIFTRLEKVEQQRLIAAFSVLDVVCFLDSLGQCLGRTNPLEFSRFDFCLDLVCRFASDGNCRGLAGEF